MTHLALVRHMRTGWNVAGRLQGRRDQPLDSATPDWRVPAELAAFRWLSSPLRRAIDTAARLGIDDFAIEPRVTEMDWGDWEGRTLAELRVGLGRVMEQNEAAGLGFRPPGGESPRDVRARLRPLLIERAGARRAPAALTHKGVRRARYALATTWG